MENLQIYEKQLFSFIKKLCGLSINEAHKNYMRSYLKKRLANLDMDLAKFCDFVKTDELECVKLINEVAINETYFFREEQQFDYLKNVYFPKFSSNKIFIWSAACATGEEPLSLYALAKSCGKEPIVYATDIDTDALAAFSKGKYLNHSFRNDGKKYHNLLENIGTKISENEYEISPELKEKIHISIFNLIADKIPPIAKESIDILFLRNVFIYFTPEIRRSVIRKISEYLSPGGLLFLSVNDIAGTTCEADVPLIKEHDGNIYFFRKVDKSYKEMYLKSCQKNIKDEARRKELMSRYFPQMSSSVRKTSISNFFVSSDRNNNVSYFSQGINQNSEIEKTKKNLKRFRNEILYSQIKNFLEKKNISTEIKKDIFCDTENLYLKSEQNIEKFSKEIFSDLAAQRIDFAKDKLLNYKFRPGNLEYKAYFSGLIAEIENDYKTAAKFFLRANLYEPNFWLAYFKLGLIYDKNGNKRESRKNFEICAKILERNSKDENFRYNFLIEQFSPSYFLNICRNYIKDTLINCKEII